MTIDALSSPTLTRIDASSKPRRFAGLHLLLRDPAAAISMTILLAFVAVAILGPFWTPQDETAIDVDAKAQGPSIAHFLGTDILGRDVLSRMMVGARPTLLVGTFSVAIASVVGVAIGLIAGYAGGLVGGAAMRLMDALYAFPALILVLGLVAVLGRGITPISVAIAVVNVPVFARLMRAQVLTIKSRDYVLAARALGCTPTRTMVFHVLPNAWAPILVQASIGVGYAILVEASLSFLGLSIPPPAPTWGGMLEAGFRYINQHPLLSVTPGLGIFIVVLACNVFGDALRDFIDPRVRRTR